MSTAATEHQLHKVENTGKETEKRVTDHYVGQKDPSLQASGRRVCCAIRRIDVISVCTPKCEGISDLFTVLDTK